MAEYYRHSGRAPLAGALATAVVGVLVASILAIIYSFAIVWIPFIYLNFLLTVAFGGLTGIIVAVLGQRVKIRNSLLLIVIALAAIAVGYYVAWGADLWARAPDIVEGDVLSAWNPSLLKEYVKFFYDKGAWSIGRTADTNVSGLFLGAVWLVEAGMIFGLSAIGVLAITGDSTFCEQCDCWSTKKDGLATFALTDERDLHAALEQGDYAKLAERPILPGTSENYLQVDAYICPSCDDHCCLNVVKVTTTINDKKEREKSTTKLIDRLQLDAGGLKQFLAAATARPAPEAGPEIGPPPDEADVSGEATIGSPQTFGPPPDAAAPSPPIGSPPARSDPGGIGPPPGFPG